MTGRHPEQTSTTPARSFAPRTRLTIRGRQWLLNDRPVHAGCPSEGLLTNVRMVNCIFEDTGLATANLPTGFDPAQNTGRFISRIPDYVGCGIAAFTISLQGGLPGYEGSVNSAFNADGSLRDAYMHRAARVIEACDSCGAAVILSCFYQRQHSHDRALAGRDAIRAAIANVARWIRARNYRNVVLEISNEYLHNGYLGWRDGAWLASDSGQAELIDLARQTAPGLPASTSGMGNGRMSAEIARAADFLLIHFNNTALQDIPERIAQARTFGKPVVCNEDNKLGSLGAEAARVSIAHGAGWGFMHLAKNQCVPFEYDGPGDDPEVYAMLRHLASPAGGAAPAGSACRSSQPAALLVTDPKDGDTFPAGRPITIHIAATAPADLPGTHIEILANGQPVAVAAVTAAAGAAPLQIIWPGVPAGTYDLVAVQRTADGREVARSNPVDIVVDDRPGSTPS